MDEPNGEGFKPPHLSFQTFWGFLEELTSKPLPPVIDRSLLSSKSGTDQAGLLSALKGFEFISADLKTEPLLIAFAESDADERKEVLGNLLREHYPLQFEVSAQNGTEKQLLDSFEAAFGRTGHTRRKAATFFLHAARTAGLSLSVHFPTTRSGSGPSATPRKRAVRRRTDTNDTIITQTPIQQGDTYKVTLAAGGTVTLTVSVSHFALSKNRSDRDFVNGLIDKLTDYGEVETTEAGAPPEAEAEDTT
jgi:hypothetical protein